MNRLRVVCGFLFAGLVFGSAMAMQEPTERDAVPRGFRMYLISDGRIAEDAKKKANPDKKAPSKDESIHYRVGKLHDPVTEHGLATVLGVFVRSIPTEEADPILKVLKFQQDLAKKYRPERLGAFMAFLSLEKDFADDDTRYARMDEIKKLSDAAIIPYVQTGLAEGKLADGSVPPQVAAWQVGAEDAITFVLFHRFKIIKRWSFKSDAPPTDADLEAIAAEVSKVVGKVR